MPSALSAPHFHNEDAAFAYVEARLWLGESWQRPIAFRGIVGLILPRIRSFDFALGPVWQLILHTDGVSARFDPDALPAEVQRVPPALAAGVLRQWGRDTDDATVVVVQPAPPEGD